MSQPDPEWLSAFPSFAALDDAAARAALGGAQIVQLPVGHMVFREGDACRHYLMVLDGSVRVQKLGESGREIVLYRVERGQTCVLTTSCLFGGARYPAEGVTETPVTAAVLPLARFNEAVAVSAGFRRFAFASFSERVADLMMLVEAIAFGRVDERLAARLLALAAGDTALSLTHAQLAAELGTAREVVSRLLKEFERRGWVALTRGQVRIADRAALAAFADNGRAQKSGV
jgi:CRP/FNR family transcriptional regulator